MNAHRSLKRLDVLRYPTDKISLMIASEFLRASSRAEYTQIVEGCFHRARELMGILETMTLVESVAQQLQPLYRECVQSALFRRDRLAPEQVRIFSARLAEKFESASVRLAMEFPNA